MTGEEQELDRQARAELDQHLDEFERYLYHREEGNRLVRGVLLGMVGGGALWVAGWALGRVAGWW